MALIALRREGSSTYQMEMAKLIYVIVSAWMCLNGQKWLPLVTELHLPRFLSDTLDLCRCLYIQTYQLICLFLVLPLELYEKELQS